MRKLPARAMPIIVALLLTGVMTLIVSGVSTLVAMGGIAPGFLIRWMSAWATSWAIAFPIMIFMQPAVRQFAARLVEQPPR